MSIDSTQSRRGRFGTISRVPAVATMLSPMGPGWPHRRPMDASMRAAVPDTNETMNGTQKVSATLP